MKRLLCSLAFLCAFSIHTYADFKEDSLRIAKQFNRALLQPESADSLIASIKVESTELRDVYHYHHARYYFAKGQLSKALIQSEKGLELAKISRNYFNAAKFFNLKGSIWAMQGKYKEGVQQMLMAVEISEKNNDLKKAAQVKNNIANIFFSLRDYESAYKYAKDSYTVLKALKDSTHLPAVTGVAAISAIKLDKVEEAKVLTAESLQYSERYSNPVGLIVSNHAQAELYQLEESYQESISAYKKSLSLSERFQQSHYVLLNKIGLMNAYLNIQDYKQTIIYGEEALAESKNRENENTLYFIHKKLGMAYAGVSNYEGAYEHARLAHEFFIKSADQESRSTINEMLIKYETEKKERQLAEKSVEVLKSQKEIDQRNNWITVLSLLFVLLIIILLFANRIAKQRVQRLKEIQEKRLLLASVEGEERERRRISNELHDGIASALTGVKMHLELFNTKEKKEELKTIVNQLAQTHEDVRRISHNLLPVQFEEHTLSEVLENYCKENANSVLKIQFNGERFSKVDTKRAQLIYRIAQELLNNVRKHAQASFCSVQLSRSNNMLYLSVEDNGIGFKTDQKLDNQGLRSIADRIAELGGNFTIESDTGKGTLAILELPIR